MNSTSNPVVAAVAEASGELIALEPRSALPTPAPTMVDERGEAQKPIDMVLHCPKCGLQHVDAPEDAECDGEVVQSQGWSNPPHKSHLCHGCGHIWRPADVPTNGVQAVKTKGKADSPIATRPTLQSLGGDAGVSGAKQAEADADAVERYLADMIDRAPEPLRRLGEWLSRKLDEDEWKTAERYLLGAEESIASTEKSDGWLPIEQAPKDETEILLARGERVTTGHWMEELEVTGSEYHSNGTYLGEFPTGEVRGGCWMSWDGGFTAEEPPTHYMPLPAAPKAAEKSGRSE